MAPHRSSRPSRIPWPAKPRRPADGRAQNLRVVGLESGGEGDPPDHEPDDAHEASTR